MSIIQLVKEEVNKISPKSEVILFGSRARGDYKFDSDWDFLILIQNKNHSKKEKEIIRDRLYEIELTTQEVISSIIHTQEEWEKRSIMPMYQIIKEEGRRA